jgi:hypothetical protein
MTHHIIVNVTDVRKISLFAFVEIVAFIKFQYQSFYKRETSLLTKTQSIGSISGSIRG